MKAGLFTVAALFIGGCFGYAFQKHVSADCSPWLANLKVCVQTITK